MPFTDPALPDWLNRILSGLGLTMASVWFGRLAWHASEVQRGNRRHFFSRDMALDIAVVPGLALVTWGIAEYLHLDAGPAAAIGTAIGWLGPRGVQAAVAWRLRQKVEDDAKASG